MEIKIVFVFAVLMTSILAKRVSFVYHQTTFSLQFLIRSSFKQVSLLKQIALQVEKHVETFTAKSNEFQTLRVS